MVGPLPAKRGGGAPSKCEMCEDVRNVRRNQIQATTYEYVAAWGAEADATPAQNKTSTTGEVRRTTSTPARLDVNARERAVLKSAPGQ